MGVTKAQSQNISSPDGNSLAVFIDGVTNLLMVKDIYGVTQSFGEISDFIEVIESADGSGLVVLREGDIVTLNTDGAVLQKKNEKGAADGYASLDAQGKLPVAQLPTSVLTYEGVWNAATNTPTLADGAGDDGDFYIVSVGGTQDLGSGPIEFKQGDWVIYNGSIWQVNPSAYPELGELPDVTITSAAEGNVLSYNSVTGEWVNSAALTTEIADRTSADATLQSNIDAEASTRASADTTLQSNIDAEEAAREAADLQLNYMIQDYTFAEQTARQVADLDLQRNIENEASARESADTTLQSNIDAEASTRASADTTLQSNIDTKESLSNKNMSNGYCGLNGNAQIANAQIPINLGNHSINNLTVLAAGEFQSNVDFEGNVDFEDVVNFYDNVTFQGTGNRLFAGAGINEFLTETKFKNAAVRIEAGMNIAAGEVYFFNGNGVRFSAPMKDYYGAKPSGSGQALISLGTSGYVQWQDVGGSSTLTGTYTVVARRGVSAYSPISEEGTYALVGDVVKCSGYVEANETMYIQPTLDYNAQSSNPAIRLTTLPFPAAAIENNIGYTTGTNWLGGYFYSDVRGGTLGTWCVTDASGTQYGSGAIVGVLDDLTTFQGAQSYGVNIYFVGPTAQFAITNGQFLKFNFEYIKS